MHLPLFVATWSLSAIVASSQAQRPPATPPAALAPAAAEKPAFETITRTLPDELVMTADLYRAPLATGDAPKPVLVCMHMTGSSRGEYRAIAPRIVAMGINVLAVDLRCGGAGEFGDRRTHERSGTMNETWKMALTKVGHAPGYLEAYPDVEQSVAWAHELFPASRVGLLGSSYSASFALVYGAEHPDQVDAVLSFSPGEYMPPWSIADKVKKIDVPTYITCGNTKAEMQQCRPIAEAIQKRARLHAYFPEDEKLIGDHGSHAMIMKGDTESTRREWTELETALAPLKKPLDAAELEKRKRAASKPAPPVKKG